MATAIGKQDDSTLASQGLPSAKTTAEKLQMEKTFSMTGGVGIDSYAQNSSFQGTIGDKVILPFFEKVLDSIELFAPSGDSPVVRVADLGCSSGFNTIAQMSHIVQKLKQRYTDNDASRSPPEFQAFFCDLPSNDFNTLFQLLTNDKEHGFFMSGTPGSVYGRLYPRSSISVFYSSFCLHWLSKLEEIALRLVANEYRCAVYHEKYLHPVQTPDAILDKNSPAFNKTGFMVVKDTSPATKRALKEQAASDLKTFLHARAIELSPGGVLMFAVSGKHLDEGKEPPNIFNQIHTRLGQLWHEFAEQGIISQEAADSFFLPVYRRNMEEILEVVQHFSSAFSIHLTEVPEVEAFRHNAPTSGTKLVHAFKATIGGTIKHVIGDEQSGVFWDRATQAIDDEILQNRDKYSTKRRYCLVALTRKKEDGGELS